MRPPAVSCINAPGSSADFVVTPGSDGKSDISVGGVLSYTQTADLCRANSLGLVFDGASNGASVQDLKISGLVPNTEST